LTRQGAVLLGAALGAWIVTVEKDVHWPGTTLGGLGSTQMKMAP